RGAKSVLCVTLGTGVGGGIVFEGSVYRGVSTMAGEIGHLPMKVDGEPCTCGRFGCLETLASATALVREGRRRGLTSPRGADTDLSAEDIFVLAARGDGEARDIVGEMVGWLARGLAAAANLLNPEVIVVGGGLAKAGDALFGPLEEQFRRLALPRAVAACRLMPAFLGNDAGLLGAARLAWRKAGIGN
ncbi:MAG: ROK family protein, partial [Alicyclobacillaceae bacterium]|nr:ROK family protein [Alicyclobacillaceae bacterium]